MRCLLSSVVLTLSLVITVGCWDNELPSAPVDSADPARPHAIRCRVDVGAADVSCQPPVVPGSPDLQFSIIVGGQGVNVQLTSTNVSYDAASEVFQADVTVQNLMSRVLGTSDGTTVDGVRVFFHSGPVVTNGTGTVTVRDPDGTGTFTGSNQPYYEYMEMLVSNETSAAKTWEWNVPSTVETFVFEVYVEAEATDPITIVWGYEASNFDQCFGPYTWNCSVAMKFTVTEGSGELWVKAAGKPGSGTYPVTPDHLLTSLEVSPRMRYQATLAVSFWGTGGSTWPRTMANWPCARFAITSPAAAGDTVFKELNPQLDTYYDPPMHFCSAEYTLGILSVDLLGVADTAKAGDWEATAGFGTFVFTVNDDRDAIEWIEYSFDNYSCGGTVTSGSADFAGDWPIGDHRFAIENHDQSSGDTYRIEGEFDPNTVEAHGTWEFTISGTTCSGAWEGQWNLPPTATIALPPDGSSYQYGETVSFSGSGVDPEDGALTDGALSWRSTRDGQLGTGASLTRNDLSVGTHKIILTAYDSHGWSGKDTVGITILASTTYATGTWQAPTEFGQFSIVVNPERTGITAITYDIDHWTCGWSAGWYWYGDGTITKEYPGWPITDGRFSIENTLVDPDLVILVNGVFETDDQASGGWAALSNGTYCHGDWEGTPATILYLREGTTPYLSPEKDPSETVRSRGATGTTWQFAATLDEAISSDTYAFWLWLRADSGGVGDGRFDASLVVNHEGSETELASTSFSIDANTSIEPFLDRVTGVSGGVAGDQLILRISYVGDGWGDLFYGLDAGAHVAIPGHWATSLPAASATAVVSDTLRPGSANVNVGSGSGRWRRSRERRR